VSFKPQEGERVLQREDCAEDRLKNGVLILTNKRILFQKTEGRMATFSKKEGDIILDIPLQAISSIKAEGFLVKKLIIVAVDQTYKFGVFSNTKWEKEIRQAKGM
jgi:hypothetical protein